MAAATIHVDVVSAEESIFSGEAKFVALPGEAGELGIYPRHTPLITRIKPGAVRITPAGGGDEQLIFVAGGILEVQPKVITVLADSDRDGIPDGYAHKDVLAAESAFEVMRAAAKSDKLQIVSGYSRSQQKRSAFEQGAAAGDVARAELQPRIGREAFGMADVEQGQVLDRPATEPEKSTDRALERFDRIRHANGATLTIEPRPAGSMTGTTARVRRRAATGAARW